MHMSLVTEAYTPPPSPTPRLAQQQRDRTRSRRNASPRLKIRRRSLGERPSNALQRPPSPELIFSMSPIDSHFPSQPPAPKTQLNPGALFARARQQSANAFAALTKPQRPRAPLLYSFPKPAAHLRAPPTIGMSRAESRPARFRFSPITDSSDEVITSPEVAQSSHGRLIPIAVPLPIPAVVPHPHKIVGFDTGTDSDVDVDSGTSSGTSPFRLEHFVPDDCDNGQDIVKNRG